MVEQSKIIEPDKKSIVSIEHCQNYEQHRVDQATERLIRNVGGFTKFIKQGDRIHIKPNLLTAKSPDKAATTHPAIVRSVVQMLKNFHVKITLGDSPAGISRPIEEFWHNTGMEDVAREFGIPLVRFEKNKVIERKVNGRSYYIAQPVAEADVVINLCKLKTHNLLLYTGAIKNMFGTIPGFRKSEYHKQAPKPDDFAEIIVDIFSAAQPQLTVMDAIVAMEGNGPSAGNPKHVGLLLASQDAVALDSVAARIIGFEDGEIKTTEIAFHRGLGEKRKERIIIIGENVDEYPSLDFLLPSNRFLNFIPSSLVRLVGKLVWVRPKPDKEKCQRCGMCIKNCPVQAMTSRNGFPIIDYDKCISCFCCDEICPYDAIDQNVSWLAKKFI